MCIHFFPHRSRRRKKGTVEKRRKNRSGICQKIGGGIDKKMVNIWTNFFSLDNLPIVRLSCARMLKHPRLCLSARERKTKLFAFLKSGSHRCMEFEKRKVTPRNCLSVRVWKTISFCETNIFLSEPLKLRNRGAIYDMNASASNFSSAATLQKLRLRKRSNISAHFP